MCGSGRQRKGKPTKPHPAGTSAEEGRACQKASLQHCSTNIINIKTTLTNLDCPVLAA